jgi:hypothetical protein
MVETTQQPRWLRSTKYIPHTSHAKVVPILLLTKNECFESGLFPRLSPPSSKFHHAEKQYYKYDKHHAIILPGINSSEQLLHLIAS